MRINYGVSAHRIMKKPLNITVADATKDRAAKLSKQYGDGSISNLFERLVSEEFDREASDVDSATSWSEPATWSAMLATMPHAGAPFRALASSPLARSAFRKATAPKAGRSKG